jgi:hypothetical protein
MNEPAINYPKCKSQIKLTESLAALLIESTRQQYEQKFSAKDAEIGQREAEVKAQQVEIGKARAAIDDEVYQKVQAERCTIAVEEMRKARLLLGTDLENKSKELVELQDVLAQRDTKLAEAQRAQAELLRKQRELDDARREMDLTIEKRVQEQLSKTREKPKQETGDELKLKLAERDKTISSLQKQIDDLKRRAEQRCLQPFCSQQRSQKPKPRERSTPCHARLLVVRTHVGTGLTERASLMRLVILKTPPRRQERAVPALTPQLLVSQERARRRIRLRQQAGPFG